MAVISDTLIEILKKPTIFDVFCELVLFAAPIWIAVFIGLIAGWAWKPKWANLIVDGKKGNFDDNSSMKLDSFEVDSLLTSEKEIDERDGLSVNIKDLKHIVDLVEESDGGCSWQKMMDRTMPLFSYKAWIREPKTGPPQYRSSTIFEDATPDVVRDFFWDDEFRMKNKWDDMLLQHEILEECPTTGTIVVKWVRKFPFFCSDREYVIGRRIWNADGTYYCVTKGVPRPSVPRQNKPKRVDLYYSSWCVRAVESRKGDGNKTACEVLLFHHEDMGIPWEIAKFGVKQGMWGLVKKIGAGLRDYQLYRNKGDRLSKYIHMAQINTFINMDCLKNLEFNDSGSCKEIEAAEKQKPSKNNFSKYLLIGGALAVACSIDRGLFTKAVIFGVARRLGKIGGRL